jgi:hypothetical protein
MTPFCETCGDRQLGCAVCKGLNPNPLPPPTLRMMHVIGSDGIAREETLAVIETAFGPPIYLRIEK